MTTMETKERGQKNKTLPLAGEHVLVHCLGFSCLGYLGEDRTWKNAFTNEWLPDVLDFNPLG